MEKEENVLGGFNVMLDSFVPKTGEEFGRANSDNEPIDDEELENIKKNSIEPALKDKTTKKEKEVETEVEEDVDGDGDELEVEPPKKNKKVKGNDNKDAIVDDLYNNDDDESPIVTNFFDAISEKLGWEFGEDEKKPNTVDELIQYFQEAIENESKPEYASEELEALDAYVKQGGDLKKYLSVDAQLDLDSLDIEDESTQKMVVKQLLKEKGFSDKQIEKKLTKYEEAGLLEDEAQDAIEDLKEINEQKKEQLLQEQKMEYKAQLQRQQQFYDNVVDGIKGLNDIRGIAIPEKDKRVLIDYILKPDTDGKTKYQKDYAKNGVKGLIESAYFTMNADRLLNAAKQVGNNSAVDRFKKSLKNSSISSKSKTQNNSNSDASIWDNFTRKLRV